MPTSPVSLGALIQSYSLNMLFFLEILVLKRLEQCGISTMHLLFLFDEPKEDQEEAPWVIKLFVIFILLMIAYSANKLVFGFAKELLGMGTFSSYFKPNSENKRLAFAVLGAHIVVSENEMMSEKYAYLASFLRRYFPNVAPLPSDEIFQKHRIYSDFQKAAIWCSEQLNETERINLLDFLIDLGFHNGSFNRRETAYIYRVGRILKFKDTEISMLLNIRYIRQEKQRTHQQSNQGSSNRPSAEHQKLKALKILGLPTATKTLEEVRKAYRDLARKHHPDRYHGASEQDQQAAHERFTEINWAHDFLKEQFGG